MNKIFVILAFSIYGISALYAQHTICLTDVMVFKSDGGLIDNKKWSLNEAEAIGIYKKTETRYYTSFGQQNSFSLDFWTWKGENSSSGSRIFKEENQGASIELAHEGTTLYFTIANNNSTYYLLVKLDNLTPSYCPNTDEGVTQEMISSVGNFLRNKGFWKYDYAIIPPHKKAHAIFRSLQGQDFIPAILPRNTIMQMCIYGAYSEIDPWTKVMDYYTKKPIIDDGVKYFTISPNDYSNLINDYVKPMIGFESRYHFKIN